MDLLSAQDHQEIRQALRDVADTFFKTPILYQVYDSNFDNFNEGQAGKKYNPYNLLALVEFGIVRENDKLQFNETGSTDLSTVKVTFNVDQLQDAGLWDAVTNFPKMNPEFDFFIMKDQEYLITQLALDGPMEDKNILVVLYADPKQQMTK